MNSIELEREADRILEAAGFDPESPSEPPDTPEPLAAWEHVSEPLRRAAEAVCTERQLEAVRLRYAGLTFEGIAEAMGLHDRAGAKRLVERGFERIESVLVLDDNFRTQGTERGQL
jgi:DNA-directed RNA polymerase specialized sigma24 family protein